MKDEDQPTSTLRRARYTLAEEKICQREAMTFFARFDKRGQVGGSYPRPPIPTSHVCQHDIDVFLIESRVLTTPWLQLAIGGIHFCHFSRSSPASLLSLPVVSFEPR